jgi:hypothetical protein
MNQTTHLISPLLLVLACALPASAANKSITAAAPAPAAVNASAAAPAKKATKPKKPTTATAKELPGSAESRAERDKRLKRECKGRPNAGACLGYGV